METKFNGYTLKILPDGDPIDPRRNCEHLGTLLAWHRQYNLGDNNNYAEPNDFFESEEAKQMYVSLPVYLLDHSVLRLSCNDFHDPWDSGRLGIIYCTEKQAKAWLGEDCTPEKAKKILYDEIEEYDTYLNSEHYGFIIEGLNGEIEDSCWGFMDTGDNKELLDRMKEQAAKEYHPLFEKLSLKMDNFACL